MPLSNLATSNRKSETVEWSGCITIVNVTTNTMAHSCVVGTPPKSYEQLAKTMLKFHFPWNAHNEWEARAAVYNEWGGRVLHIMNGEPAR